MSHSKRSPKKAKSNSFNADTLTDPSSALATLLESVSISHGSEGVRHVMERIRSATSPSFMSRISSSSATHRVEESSSGDALNMDTIEELEGISDSILSSLGEERARNILVSALSDGSSMICPGCNGLIKKDRYENHVAYWCQTSASTLDPDTPRGKVRVNNFFSGEAADAVDDMDET